MPKSRTYSPSVAAIVLVLLLTACASDQTSQQPKGPFEAIEQIFKLDNRDRPYVVLDNSRFISGPYGDKNEIQQIVDAIKLSSKPVTLSNRIVDLPNKPANLSLTVYDYQAPAECGGYHFRVYEGQDLQILQYDLQNGSEITRIRDYTMGPTPFVSAGLWGPYDHTDDTALDMCLLPGDTSKDGGGLMEGSYEIGWITTIVDWKQADLGQQYADAVRVASPCLHRLASLGTPTRSGVGVQAPRQYRIQPGDSLSGIAKKMYGKPSAWRKIYDSNADLIGPDPNAVPAGVVLTIP